MNFMLPFYLLISAFFGIYLSKTCVHFLIAIELALLGCGLNYILASLYLDDIGGQAFALIILSVAGAESAIGLAILVAYFRRKGNVLLEKSAAIKA